MIKINRKSIIIVALFVAFLLLIKWISSHAFISVTVPASGTDLTYTFVNQNDGKSKTIVSSDSAAKQLLATGSYEVYVQGEIESYMTIEKAGRFLQTTTVTAQLAKENAREFVGENAAPCANYISDRLYSYECDAPLNSVTQHVPAIQAQPTYTLSAGLDSPASIESIAYTPQGTVIFTGAVFLNEEELITNYRLGLLSDKFSIANSKVIPGLGFDMKYELKEYRDGFLLYSTDLSEVYYYPSMEAEPATLSLEGPKDSSLNPVGLTVKDNQLVTFYSSVDADDDIHEITDATTEIIIHGTENTTHYTLPTAVTDIEICGDNLCTITEKVLSVYKLGAAQPELLYQIKNALSVDLIAAQTLVVTDKGILNINAASKSGSYSYSFGDYSGCGLQRSANGYIVCLIDRNDNKHAVSIDVTSPATNNRDKSLGKLQKDPRILSASIYKNIVFITPKMPGASSSNNNRNGVYSDEQIAMSQKIISDATTAAGLTDSELTIINTVDPF